MNTLSFWRLVARVEDFFVFDLAISAIVAEMNKNLPVSREVSGKRSDSLHLDFSVDTSWKADVHEAVDGLWSWVHNIDKTLVYTHFKLLTTFFVDVRAFDHGVGGALGWKWNRASNYGTSSEGGVDDLLGSLVDYFMIVSLQANTNPLFFGLLGVSHRKAPSL